MKLKFALAVVAVVALAAASAALLPAPPAHAASAAGSPENPFLASASIRSALGVGLTVTTAGVTLPKVGSATLLVESRNTGGITFSATNGTWTVAQGAAGAYEVIATVGNCKNSVAAHTNLFQIYKNTTAVGSITKRVEPAAAVEGNCGMMLFVGDLVAGDVISVKADAADSLDVITVKDFSFFMRRVGPRA